MALQLELFDFTEKQVLIPVPDKASQKKGKEKRIPKEIFDLMDALTSPVIVYPSSWKDTIPQKIFDDIIIARLISLMKGEEVATIPEVVAYIYPASLQFPLNHHWTNIYLWVCGQYMENFRKQNLKKLDLFPESLDDYEQSLLNSLRVWIYEKRRQALRKNI
jgi:hypothetical protein